MTPSKNKKYHDAAMHGESRFLAISLFVLYSIFVYSAFIRCDFFWGINFLYYLPPWQKAFFIAAGGLVFWRPFNRLIFTLFHRIAHGIIQIQGKTKGFPERGFYLIGIALTFGAVFYLLRVVSLCHSPIGAIYFMERGVPIIEYYRNWAQTIVEDKIVIPIYWGFFRYVLHSLLQFSPYWSLAIPSIIFGIIFVILLDTLIRKIDIIPVEKLFLSILIFTQAITYYYFGYANYYAPIPVTLFLYIFSMVLYFRNSISIAYPILAAILCIMTHLSSIFILPSLVFIAIHKYRGRLRKLYDLFIFRPLKMSVLIFSLFFIAANAAIRTGFLSSHAQQAITPLFSLPTMGYGWNLLSVEYFVHLINMLVLISPIGLLLFLFFVKYVRRITIWGELKYCLLWLSIGGLIANILVSPQTIYTWDIYGWTSTGFTALGALLFLYYAGNSKSGGYLTTLTISHALLYFSAWIALNHNIEAAAPKFLDTAETFDPQLAWCLQMLNEDPRDRNATRRLLIDLEERAVSKEDYSGLAANYAAIGDQVNHKRMYEKYLHLLQEAIREDPDNAYNYYQYIKTFSDEEKKDPRSRAAMEPYYLKAIELDPGNINYYTLYAVFLVDTGDKEKAYPVFRKIDSLYTSQGVSMLETSFPHTKIKIDLVCLSFIQHDNLESIRYFKEALALGAGFGDKNFELAVISCLGAYANMGNLGKGRELLAFAHDHNAAMNYDDAILSKETAKGKEYGLSRLKAYLNAGNFMELRKTLEFMTEDNPDPDFEIFWCPVYLWGEQYQELLNKASEILRHDESYPYAHIFIGIGYLESQKFDSAAAAFNLETKLVPDSAYKGQALESKTISPYLSQFLNDAQHSDSLKRSLRSVLSHVNR